MQPYPKSRSIRFDAWLAVGAWVLLLVFMTGAVLSWTSFELQGKRVLVWALGTFLLVVVVRLPVTLSHRCPVCQKRPTVQGFAPIHDLAKHDKGLDGWSRVVWNVFRNRPFRCIHCGEQFLAE